MHKQLIYMVVLFASCDPGNVVLLAPDKSPSEAPSLTIHAVIDTPYADVANALEWTAGIPAAQVRVHQMEEPYDESYWHVAATDSSGLATFNGLLSGLYEVEVMRWLSGPEMAQADSALHLLAGGRRMHVSPGARQDVTIAPDHRRSLVFAEFFYWLPSHWETGGLEYPDAFYFEIYNNSDSTVYLDGKYWGFGWDKNRDYSAWPCSQTEGLRNDPRGIWTQRVLRFPGTGSDYPIAPGQAVLVAKSAIDHRPVHSGLYDLSHADFEWGGARNPDNPDVPNLVDIGLRSIPSSWPGANPQFLSEPVDLETLPRYVDPQLGYVWVRVPSALILDAWVGTVDWTTQDYEASPACRDELHRSFERLPGPAYALSDFYDALSFQRRVLYVLPDGRKVLQDTDTSMEDFVKAVRSPGWIPDSLP